MLYLAIMTGFLASGYLIAGSKGIALAALALIPTLAIVRKVRYERALTRHMKAEMGRIKGF